MVRVGVRVRVRVRVARIATLLGKGGGIGGGFGGGSLEHPRQWCTQGRPLPWECRATRSQACPEEAQQPSWGAAKGALWPMPSGDFGHAAVP
eukprot:scaffold35776_cov63-Phaeocystis_antarctica.AAC.1